MKANHRSLNPPLNPKEILVSIAELFTRLIENIQETQPAAPGEIKQGNLKTIMQELAEIKSLLNANRRVLNIDQAAAFLGMKKSYLHKLTAAGTVPHSKPNGGDLYFDKDELTSWALGAKQINLSAEAERLFNKSN